jgi:hypothetical protein
MNYFETSASMQRDFAPSGFACSIKFKASTAALS